MSDWFDGIIDEKFPNFRVRDRFLGRISCVLTMGNRPVGGLIGAMLGRVP